MELQKLKQKYNPNNIKISENPSVDLKYRPDLQKMMMQGFLSNTHLQITKHLSGYLGRDINDFGPQDFGTPAELKIVMEHCFPSPLHKGEPFRSDIFIQNHLEKNWCIEIDSPFHHTEERKCKDEYKDEVASRGYEWTTVRHEVVVPPKYWYNDISNPTAKAMVKQRYEEVFLQKEAIKVLGLILDKASEDQLKDFYHWLERQDCYQNN